MSILFIFSEETLFTAVEGHSFKKRESYPVSRILKEEFEANQIN